MVLKFILLFIAEKRRSAGTAKAAVAADVFREKCSFKRLMVSRWFSCQMSDIAINAAFYILLS
jgi:hypothetical protein